jgi:hypothetical protein
MLSRTTLAADPAPLVQGRCFPFCLGPHRRTASGPAALEGRGQGPEQQNCDKRSWPRKRQRQTLATTRHATQRARRRVANALCGVSFFGVLPRLPNYSLARSPLFASPVHPPSVHHGPHAQQWQGYLQVGPPLPPRPARVAEDVRRGRRGPHLQARQEGYDSLPDRRRAAGQPRHRPGQECDGHQGSAHPQEER